MKILYFHLPYFHIPNNYLFNLFIYAKYSGTPLLQRCNLNVFCYRIFKIVDSKAGKRLGIIGDCISNSLCPSLTIMHQPFQSKLTTQQCWIISMSKCKKDVTQMYYQWSYIFLALTSTQALFLKFFMHQWFSFSLFCCPQKFTQNGHDVLRYHNMFWV